MSLKSKTASVKCKTTDKYSHIAVEIQTGLASLLADEVCTDFEVVVHGRSFHCHKAVLASVSDYFRAMFQSGMKESVESKVVLDNISTEAFTVILDLLYLKKGDPDPLDDRSDDELSELLRVADMFQMNFLSKICLDIFQKTMTASNCIERWEISKATANTKFTKNTLAFIVKNFDHVVKDSAMLSMDYKDFALIISNDYLRVKDEISVWHVISDWIDFDITTRGKYLVDLLKNCCLTEINHLFLIEEMAFDYRIRSDTVASKLVQRAIKFRSHPGDHGNMELKFRYSMKKEQVSMLFIVPEGDVKLKKIRYSARTNEWDISTIAGLNTVDFACCVHGRDVYVSGGTGQHGDVMHKYSSVNEQWDVCGGTMSVALKRHAMTATDDNLYAIGGRSGGQICRLVLQFCLKTEKWDIHGEVVAPVEYASAVCMDSKIYIMGGVLSDDDPVMAADSVQMYDTKTKAATILQCQLPSPCAFSRAICRHDQIFMVTCNGEIVRLSGKNLESQLVATIPDFKGQTHFGLAMQSEEIWIIGGVFGYDTSNMTVSKRFIRANVTSGKVVKENNKNGYIFYGGVSAVQAP